MKIPFLAFILQGIPEMIAIVLLAFVITKASLEWKKICIIGIIMGFASYFIRLLPLTFGIHTVILIGILFIILSKYARVNFNSALIGSLLSFLAIIVAETISLSLLMPIFNVTSEILFTNTIVRVLISWPQILFVIALSFCIHKFRLYKLNR